MSQNESAQKRKRGGQPGNKNAVTHGFYTEGGKKRFEQVDALILSCHTLLKAIKEGKNIDTSQFKLTI
jgi:hypothetical protein